MPAVFWEYMSLGSTFWSKYGSFITGVFGIVAALAALTGARVWASRFRTIFEHSSEAINFAHYSELDKFYADILRLAIEMPYLRTPVRILSDRDALEADYFPYPDKEGEENEIRSLQYDAYAYMVWNFLEAIRDRCADKLEMKATWAPVIGAENAIHRGWFMAQIRKEEMRAREAAQMNIPYLPADKFCVDFQVFVVNCEWKQRDGKYRDWRYRGEFKEARDLRRTLAFE